MNIRTHRMQWALMSAGLALGWMSTALAASKVYVANETDGTVSVIATDTRRTVQATADGLRVWVTNNGTPPADAGHAAHQGMPGTAHAAMASPGEVWAIETATDTVVGKVPVGKHPAHVVVFPDGRWVYVTNGGDDTVSVVDAGAMKVVATIATGAFPHGIRLSPDGQHAYVANLKGGTVSVIDTASRKAVASIPVGRGPAQVGFTDDGRLAFVSLSQEDRVAVIDPKNRAVMRKVAVGSGPIQLFATPDSQRLLVANQGSPKNPGRTVSVIDLTSFKVTASIRTGRGAHGVVVDADGRQAYVSNLYDHTVTVIDLVAHKPVATVPVGAGPNGISVTP